MCLWHWAETQLTSWKHNQRTHVIHHVWSTWPHQARRVHIETFEVHVFEVSCVCQNEHSWLESFSGVFLFEFLSGVRRTFFSPRAFLKFTKLTWRNSSCLLLQGNRVINLLSFISSNQHVWVFKLNVSIVTYCYVLSWAQRILCIRANPLRRIA